MEGETMRLIKVWLSVLLSLCYCYFIASRIPKGKFRLLSLVPIFFLFTILPLTLTTVLPTGITAFFITWLANFKLLLFSTDSGPLSSDPPKSLPLFISLACLPIRIKQQEQHPSHQNEMNASPSLGRTPNLPQNLPIKALILAILFAANGYKHHVRAEIVIGLYSFIIYLFVDIIMGSCNATVCATLGIELELPSDEPYLSTSLQDFWGRRWNLMATNSLRHTIYKPVRSASEAAFGTRKCAPVPARLAAFLVSGLVHELLFFYITRAPPTWEVTGFFVLHGACLVVEIGVKNALLAHGLRLPWPVSGPLTVGFVVVTAGCLFFPPLIRNGVDARVFEECGAVTKLLKGKM